MKSPIKILLWVVGVLILFAFIKGQLSDSPKTPDAPRKRTTVTNHEAKAVAEGQVETLLKSPSTADFSGLRDTKFESIEHGYRVIGYVDSQNGFGAMIRSKYSVEIFVDQASGNIMYRNLKVE